MIVDIDSLSLGGGDGPLSSTSVNLAFSSESESPGAGPGPSTTAQLRASAMADGTPSFSDASVSLNTTPAVEALVDEKGDKLFYRAYRNEEEDLPSIIRLCSAELSEPYNVYTFRYFLMTWPHLTFLVFPTPTATEAIAIVVCKQDQHRNRTNRGYIAMLSVDKRCRRRGIGRKLVQLEIEEMSKRGAHEIVLETEYNNKSSLALYGSLGFLREKRLFGFYSSGYDAFRLILPLPTLPRFTETREQAEAARWVLSAEVPDPDQMMATEGGQNGHRSALVDELLRGPESIVSLETAQARPPLPYMDDLSQRPGTPKPLLPPRPDRPNYII